MAQYSPNTTLIYGDTSTGSITCGDVTSTGNFSGANVYATTAVQAPTISGTNMYATTLVQAPTIWGSTTISGLSVNAGSVISPILSGTQVLAGSMIGAQLSGTNIYASTLMQSSTVYSTNLSGGTLYVGTVNSTGAVYAGTNFYGSGATIEGNAFVNGNISGTNVYATTAVQTLTYSGTTINVGSVICTNALLSGGQVIHRTATNTAYTTIITDYYVAQTGTTGSTITLGSVTNQEGRTVIIKDEGGNAGTNNIWVVPQAGNIDGVGSKAITANYNSYTIVCGSPNWFII